MTQFEYLKGSGPGEILALTQVLTTIGTPDFCQVTCIRRVDDYAVRCSNGPSRARLNSAVLGETPVLLYDRDVLELGADRLRFQIHDPRAN